MSANSIIADVEAAHREVGEAVGNGKPFTVTLIEPGAGQTNPWDPPESGDIEHGGIVATIGTVPDRWIDGTLIRVDDELINISGAAPQIEQDWRVRMNGLEYAIQAIRKQNDGGVVLRYNLVLRR